MRAQLHTSLIMQAAPGLLSYDLSLYNKEIKTLRRLRRLCEGRMGIDSCTVGVGGWISGGTSPWGGSLGPLVICTSVTGRQ